MTHQHGFESSEKKKLVEMLSCGSNIYIIHYYILITFSNYNYMYIISRKIKNLEGTIVPIAHKLDSFLHIR